MAFPQPIAGVGLSECQLQIDTDEDREMRKRNLGWKLGASLMIASLLTITTYAAQQASVTQSPKPDAPRHGQVSPTYGNLPVTFEANQGQFDAQAKFVARGKGYSAFLTAGGMVLSLRPGKVVRAQQESQTVPAQDSSQSLKTTLQFNLLGATQNPTVVGEDQQPGRVNYFIGRDPKHWRTNVPTYARVRYKNVYPGIDLVYYGNPRQLEYDFEVSAAGNPNLIRFEIKGPNQIQLDPDGDLILKISGGELRFQSPIVYQQSKGQRVPVQGAYFMNDARHIAFHVGQYDSSKPLVIDPVLVYSTYLGGSGNDQPTGIAVDKAGSVYVTGFTDSADFPLATLGCLPAGADHVFVAKLDSTGSNLVHADYIGGNNQDYGYALVLDSANEVYVTGGTTSSDFPVVNPYQSSLAGLFNGFLTKLSADGSSLLYSTYLGGNTADVPSATAIDSVGSVIVAGSTFSTNFPVVNAYQATVSPNQGGLFGEYGFLTKFSPDGSSLIYSTYLGGNSNVPYNCGTPCWGSPFSGITGIAVDSNGSAYAVGNTNTYNFPTTPGAYLLTDSTQQNSSVGFLSKFGGSGDLDYSTYFYESSGADTNLNAIAVDGAGSAYVTGQALSDGTLPTTSTSICDPSVYGWGCNFAFVTKFDPTGSTLMYSTFLGPNNEANPQAIALDTDNDAYVLSLAVSTSFSLVNGIEPYTNENDLLLVEIDPLASSQLFATFLGGGANEFPAGMALDSNGNLYIAGSTDSTDFPITQGAFQNMLAGGTDAFVLKIGPNSGSSVALSPSLLEYAMQAIGSTSQPQTVLLRNMGSSRLSISSITAHGDFAEADNCGTNVPAAANCTFSVTFAPTGAGSRSGSVVILDDAAGSPHLINLTGDAFGPIASLAPTSLIFPGQQAGSTSAAQTVTLTNIGNTMLNLSGVQVTGDFAQTDNCSAQLAAGSSCTINITFTPTASGTRIGTLTASDNAASSPQTERLMGSESDFSLASSPGSDTVKVGSAANYNLTVSPVGGPFAFAVKLTCSGLPAQTSCSLSPNAVTPGRNTATSTLSITTTATVAQAVPSRTSQSPEIYAIWIQLQAIGLLGIMLAAPTRPAMKTQTLGFFFLAAGLVFMIGCGETGFVPTPRNGTTPGTYTITVKGTSGGLQHSLPVTLIVQ
jgi:Beta-propeller repeat